MFAFTDDYNVVQKWQKHIRIFDESIPERLRVDLIQRRRQTASLWNIKFGFDALLSNFYTIYGEPLRYQHYRLGVYLYF